MSRTAKLILVTFIAFWAGGCKERFDPALRPQQSNFLVVEGFINANGFTNIALRRTLPLKDSATLKAETNAEVTIVGDNNSVYAVNELGNGAYRSDSVILNTNQKYRLHIKTTSGGEYLSEFVAVRKTPPIDNVSWKLENGGVQIYVDTHDPQNNTRYYKWDYEETWEIHSAYANYFEYENGFLRTRSADEVLKLFYCWRMQNSTSIVLASSAQLANDVINLAPVRFIPGGSEEISVRYSILIKQYAVDRQAYDFFKILKSNTESLGSIFDPLPSEITGNISCVSNPSEKVIGYISASTVDQKRIFISSSEVPSSYSLNCETTYVRNNPDSIKAAYESGNLLPYQADPASGPVKGYFSSSPYCIDCTLRGTNVKPSFW